MVGLAMLLSGLLLPAPAGAAEPGLPTLAPGPPLERALSGREQHEYAISLVRGQILHLVVEQQGLDLVEELSGPDGRLLLRVDTPRGAYGPEALWAVARETGRHRLRIRALDEEMSGNYAVAVVAIRPSTRADGARAEAERVHMSARDWEGRATESARRDSRAGLARALVLWQAVGDPEQEALVWVDQVRFRLASGDSRGGIDAAEHGLERARAAQDRQLEAKVLAHMGMAQEFVGDPQRGIETLERAITLARAVGDRQQEGAALHLQAWGHWSLGRYQEALDLDERALAIARSNRDREQQAWALNGLGLTYWALGDPEKSLGVFEESLGLWRKLGDGRSEAFTLENLGFSYWTLGSTRRALAAYEQVLPVARALGDRMTEALALNNEGLAQTRLGNFAAAESTLTQALALWKAMGNLHGTVISLHNLGSAREGLGLLDEAVAAWNLALETAGRTGERRTEAMTLASMARLEARRGAFDEARARIEQSLAIIESLRGQIGAPTLRSSFLSAQQDEYAIAMDVFLALEARGSGGGNAAAAFQVSEKARARALVDAIVEARLELEQDLPEDLRQREKELGAQITSLRSSVAAAGASRAEAEGRLERAEEEWERLIAEMRRRTPRYASLRYPEPVSAEEARRTLDASTAIVSYSISAERVVVFVVTASGLSARRLAVAPSQLGEHVEDFVALIARDDGDRWRRLGGRLYADLVEPWIGALPEGTKNLIVIPDGVLASLPFEVLSPPTPGARRLVDSFDISYAPSVTALAQLRADRPRGAGVADILIVADPRLGGGEQRSADGFAESAFDLAALPHASAEARAIARFGGPGTEVLTGPSASERRLREARLDRFRVLHFATHGLLDTRHPSRSGLLLTGEDGADGLLTAREIHRLSLKSDLVVLAACQTARGRILAGEGVQSLARAFFHAGASSVVATLWNVDDRHTERLMKTFYGRLAAGESKAAALSGAKRDLLAEEPGLAPRSWAPFVIIGERRGSVALRPPSWWQALLWR